jgi:hypothetical protein
MAFSIFRIGSPPVESGEELKSMRLRIIDDSKAVGGRNGRVRLAQVFRWQLGSWAGSLRRAEVWIDERAESGPGFTCRVHATLNDWADLSVHALGSDLQCAVRSAARQLIGQLRRRARVHCSPSTASR